VLELVVDGRENEKEAHQVEQNKDAGRQQVGDNLARVGLKPSPRVAFLSAPANRASS
jgi:hypothetical protein